MTHDQKAHEQTHDPDGVPTGRQMKAVQQHDTDPIQSAEEGWQVGKELAHVGESEDAQRKKAVISHDEVRPTSPGVQVTSPGIKETIPTPLTARPAVAVEGPKAERGNAVAVKEYVHPASRLPETIGHKEIAAKAATYGGGQ